MEFSSELEIQGMNTILYCTQFKECIRFYTDIMGFPVVSNYDWFTEFKLGPGMYLSCMDENHTSIKSSNGAGSTITLKVDDAEKVHTTLKDRGADIAKLKVRHWGVKSFFLHDPEGYRLEIWSEYKKET